MTDLQMYSASVIADSISPEGHRITTVRVVYPHAVHKDMLRHRCMNRNVESFRAQKPEDLIGNLRSGHAFKPDVFARRAKGMGQSSEAVAEAKTASDMWDLHVQRTCDLAEHFVGLDIAKQQINFLLQDLCPLTEVITATDWSNFYALRTELMDDGTPVARPEVYKTAVAIKEAIEARTPQPLEHGWLHLPMLTSNEIEWLCLDRDDPSMGGAKKVEDFWIGVSAGRCARISYGDYKWWEEGPVKSWDRSRKLLQSGHMSPFEQQARCFSIDRWKSVKLLQSCVRDPVTCSHLQLLERQELIRQLEYSGNLHGWMPARKDFENEWDYGLIRTAS